MDPDYSLHKENKDVRSNILKTLLTLAIISMLPASARAEGFTPEQKAEIEKIIEQHINAHPEIIMNSVENFRKKQEEEQMANAGKAIEANMAFLAAADAPSVGNPKADVTVIEFFDYNCGYCKRAVPDIQKLLADDKNLRVVFHEMPILSETSLLAARWAMAAHKQGKYFEYHVALMNSNGQKDEVTLEKLAKDTGLDAAQMKKDAASEEIGKEIEKSMTAAREIGVNGTPAFIINGTLYPGYLGPDGLAASIASEREKGGKKE